MNRFEYLQPKDLNQASQWLADTDKTTLPVGGGSDLLGLIKHHITEPQALVNLKNIEGLSEITFTTGQGLTIGSQVKIAEIAENQTIRKKYPVLAQAAEQVASPQLRNMGTLGGNLCQRPRCWYYRGDFDCLRKGGDLCYAVGAENKYHCIVGGGPCYIVHPSDTAVALLALDAQISIYSNGETRTIPLDDFFVLPETDALHENILKPGEIVTAVHIPELPSNTRSAYIKFKERSAWDFAVVSVALVMQLSGKKIRNGRLAFGGVAPRPWQEPALNQGLTDLQPDEQSVDAFVSGAFGNALTLEKNEYKVVLVRNLIKSIIEELSA